ncbi:phosphate/phosphite/phosphonate ABC transporter substrate-binding protein [sulfur-oxidizing endosymbiont of Gigantopelta aegis]|uniref:phosphate/phosphite/phosphonate ABC transporter substrate-binding protein n=1 Tax=sulfur-oxidizing endosymbiont of Gigantopelta aegis TaxID=2794934 RepID=UPI0018DD96B9|nr:phosphate/phosphite/phosphonate ABC transporter substrate-binding protein [sulfur-oxidizing endosymbiont of Gigantopelta aegis]
MTHKIFLVAIYSFLLAFFVPTNASAEHQHQAELLFGSVAMDIPAVMHKRLSPLTNYLSQTLNIPVSLKLAPNMKTAIADTVNGDVDLVYLTPVAYLKAHKKSNTRLVVKTVTKGKGSFRLMIVVNKNSPIKTLEQLKGKNFAFGDKAALLQRAVVVGSGIPMNELGNYEFLGHYDNIVRAVINGDFDAGIVKDTMAYKWQGKGIRILYRSDELPPYNISVSKHIDDDLLKKIQQAFLQLDPNDPEHLAIIQSVDKKYNGFAYTEDKEYDVIRQLIKPFQ